MSETVEQVARQLRTNYDRLSNGDKAVLRRCQSVDDVLLEGAFWRSTAGISPGSVAPLRWLAQLVLLFGTAEQLRTRQSPFRFGRFLARHGIKEIRIRQLIHCRDPDELTARTGRLLRHVEAPVEWGVLGRDLRYFFSSDQARQRWTQDYFTAGAEEKEG